MAAPVIEVIFGEKLNSDAQPPIGIVPMFVIVTIASVRRLD